LVFNIVLPDKNAGPFCPKSVDFGYWASAILFGQRKDSKLFIDIYQPMAVLIIRV
jgi:hypothetical protein